MSNGKDTPRQPTASGAPGSDLLPWAQGAGDGDPVQQRIAALFSGLETPPEADLRQLARMRARLSAAVRPRSVPRSVPRSGPRSGHRSRAWVWALTGALLLLGSGVVVAARGWMPQWLTSSVLGPRAEVAAPRAARPRKTRPIAAEQAPAPAPAAAVVAEAVPDVRPAEVVEPPAPPAVRRRVPSMAPSMAPGSEAALLETAVARLRRDRDGAGTLQILDRYDARFSRGVLRGEATRLRVDALLLTEDRAGALSLLEGMTLSGGARDIELALIRGELLAARGDCRRALPDFARVSAATVAVALRHRARAGRTDCEMRLGQPAMSPQ